MPEYAFPLAGTARSIANALSWATGKPIPENQVIVEPTGNAGEFRVTVYENADTLKQVIKFTDANGNIPTRIGELCLVGYRTNRQPALLNLAQHGQIIGATESGKSSLLQLMIAHATRCIDCILWVGGNWKLADLIGEWLQPYLDTGLLPPIDYVAHGQYDVCNMMAAFMKIAAYRMGPGAEDADDFPFVILVLDEVTYIVGDKQTRGDVNGSLLTASEMLAGIARGTAGADMYEWIATQRDTFDNMGTEGGTTISQMQFSFIFRIRDYQTIGRITNDYGIPIPKNSGECWGDLGPGYDVAKLRVPYVQSANKRKRVLHDGPKIPDISWARRNITPMRQMDPGSAEAGGEHYANRFRLVDADYMRYIRVPQAVSVPSATQSNLIVTGNGLREPTPVEIAAAEDKWERMVAEKLNAQNGGSGNVDGSLALAPVAAPINIAELRTLKEQVWEVVRMSEEPLGRGDIIEQLSAEGVAVRNVNTITNICGNYCNPKDGSPAMMGKTDEDRYYAL